MKNKMKKNEQTSKWQVEPAFGLGGNEESHHAGYECHEVPPQEETPGGVFKMI